MNLTLFISQLNQILQDNSPSLRDICELLHTHTASAVTIADVEILLPEHTPKNGDEHRLILPVVATGVTLDNLTLHKFGDPFSEEENLAAGVALSICTLLTRQHTAEAETDTRRRKSVVRNMINTLSFSELEAAVAIIEELSGDEAVDRGTVLLTLSDVKRTVPMSTKSPLPEGLLIAGHIADRLGFTRSVVTAALKKLEGAGLIETRSLGMKGTYIRVKETMLVEELGKL